LAPEMLESQSRAVKTHYTPRIQTEPQIGSLGWPMTSSKNYKTYPKHNVIYQKPKSQDKNFCKFLNYTTSWVFEGIHQLSNSIWCWVMADKNLLWEGKSYLS